MQQPTKVVTGIVRFSYANVWEAREDDNGNKKFSVSILIPKTDIATLTAINNAVDAAIEAGKSKLATTKGTVVKAALKLPLRDGDLERPDDDAYRGMYFFNASSGSQPKIVDSMVQPILDQSEFYSGCWGRASINFYAFSASGNKGIAAGLNNLQKVKDGDPLAGGSTPEEDFEPVSMPGGGLLD